VTPRNASAFGVGVLLSVLVVGEAVRAAEDSVPLTVCADPNDLPYSNEAQQGFENKIARLIAADIHHPLRYVWWPQRRGFLRKTLGSGRCDLWLGVASGMEHVVSTRPYYRSTYVFATRESDSLAGLTLDDPRLKTRLIGVQMLGTEATNTPPAHALAERGLISNVRGYMVYGDATQTDPGAAILDALVNRKIDVAVVWGPQAGFYARHSSAALRLEPVTPAADPSAPMTYEISMAVRKNEGALRRQIEQSLEANSSGIHRILDQYGVPQLPMTPEVARVR
jgi:mxaJ protein